MKKKVNILLSTYNGEKYIEQQLNSLLAQTYENIDIYIRDDNSKDNTIGIIEHIIKENKTEKQIYILDNHHQNLGYPDCFWELLDKCQEADYYSFCDQDDYWEPEKIEKAVGMLESLHTPGLFFHAYEICDEKLNCNYVYTYPKKKIEVNDMLFWVFAQGFSLVLNKELKEMVQKTMPKGKQLPHDIWCLWVAYINGQIVFTDEVLAKYRRYEGAVTTTHGSLFTKVKGAFANELFGNRLREFQYRFDLLLDLYGRNMKTETKNALTIYSTRNRGFLAYIKKVFYGKRIMPSVMGEIVFRIAFLFGKI